MKTQTNKLEIEYCTQCHWLLRATWMAQELLTTFNTDITSLALVPGTGGIFEVRLNDAVIYSRKATGRFPESKELKQLVRDVIDPERPLGHSDR
jgi:selenoprotein W-related protein